MLHGNSANDISLVFFANCFTSEVPKHASYQLLFEAEGWPVEAAFYAAKLASGCKSMRLDQTTFFVTPKKIPWILKSKHSVKTYENIWKQYIPPLDNSWQPPNDNRWPNTRGETNNDAWEPERGQTKTVFQKVNQKTDRIRADLLITAGVGQSTTALLHFNCWCKHAHSALTL